MEVEADSEADDEGPEANEEAGTSLGGLGPLLWRMLMNWDPF